MLFSMHILLWGMPKFKMCVSVFVYVCEYIYTHSFMNDLCAKIKAQQIILNFACQLPLDFKLEPLTMTTTTNTLVNMKL